MPRRPFRPLPAALRPVFFPLVVVPLVFVPLVALAFAPASDGATATEPLGWHDRWSEASAEAAATERLIFVDLYAEWCGWCKRLERDVFSTPAFHALSPDFVFLRVDVDDGGEGSALQSRYRAGSLPTSLLLDPAGALVGQIVGYSPTPRFLDVLQAQVEEWRRLVRVYDRAVVAAEAGRALDHAEQLAASFHERQDGPRAATLYRLAIGAARPADGRLLYALADAERLSRAYDLALTTLAKARDAARGDTELDEQIDLLRFRIAQDRGDCGAAIAVLQRFVAEHPKSDRLDEARRTLRELTRSPDAACA